MFFTVVSLQTAVFDAFGFGLLKSFPLFKKRMKSCMRLAIHCSTTMRTAAVSLDRRSLVMNLSSQVSMNIASEPMNDLTIYRPNL